MELDDLIYELIRYSMPKGDLKVQMFAFHNSMVGKSKYFPKVENVNTFCGSCILRVRGNVLKYYHYEYEPKNENFFFTGKFAIHQVPVYGIHKKR